MLIVGWWSSSPQIDSKETLDYVPIGLRFFSRPVVVATLLIPPLPESPPRRPPFTSLFSYPDFLSAEMPQHPLVQSRALVLSPSRAAPPDLLGSGVAGLVGGSEPSLTACFQ